MTDRLLLAVLAFACRVLMSVSVDDTLLPRLVNLSTSFKELPFSVEMLPLWLKHMCSVLWALTWKPLPAATRSRPCSSVSAWAGVFTRQVIKRYRANAPPCSAPATMSKESVSSSGERTFTFVFLFFCCFFFTKQRSCRYCYVDTLHGS